MESDKDIPLDLRRELMQCATDKQISYQWLCGIYRKAVSETRQQDKQLVSRLNWAWGELMQFRETHQQWVTHLEHCASCPDCQAAVVAQVGSLEKHRGDVATYTAIVDAVRDAAAIRAASK